MCRYVQHYGLDTACDDVVSVLKRVAVRLGKTQKVKVLTGTGEMWGLGPAGFRGPAHRAGLAVWGEHCGDTRVKVLEREGLLPRLPAAGLGAACPIFPGDPPAQVTRLLCSFLVGPAARGPGTHCRAAEGGGGSWAPAHVEASSS